MADNNILQLAQYVQNQGDIGKQSGLAKLLGRAYGAPEDQQQQILATVAARGAPDMAFAAQGKFNDQRKQAYDDLGQEAGMFVALAQSGDDATTQAAYQRLVAKSAAAGHPVPPSYDPKMLPMIEKLASTIGGGSATGVQSTYIDAQGNRVAVLRDGSTQVLGQNAPNNQIIDTGNGFYGVNKGSLQAAPVMTGGAPQQSAPQAPGEVPFSIDPSLPPEVQASIRANEPAYAAAPDGAQVNIPPQGQQLRSAPKPAAAPAPETFSQPQTAMIGGKPTLVQFGNRGTVRPVNGAQPLPTAGGKPADDAKAQKIAAARADALDSVTQAISGIDSLTKSEGFNNLGTYMGDALSMIPHTKTKDASNALDTVKNQVLLTTLGKLKALSATGASGFGALSNKEGAILQNSIANLEKSQSHEAILQNLKIIRGTLQRAAGLIGGDAAPAAKPAGHVDDLLSKYGVK